MVRYHGCVLCKHINAEVRWAHNPGEAVGAIPVSRCVMFIDRVVSSIIRDAPGLSIRRAPCVIVHSAGQGSVAVGTSERSVLHKVWCFCCFCCITTAKCVSSIKVENAKAKKTQAMLLTETLLTEIKLQ